MLALGFSMVFCASALGYLMVHRALVIVVHTRSLKRAGWLV